MKKRIFYTLGILLLIPILLIGLGIIQYKILDRGTVVAAPKVTSIPFRLSTDGAMLIDIALDQSGKKYAFVLDTGACNFMYQNFPKEKAGLPIFMGMTRDTNGILNFPVIKTMPFVAFGGIQIEDASFMKINHSFNCFDNEYGIIGKNIMRHFAWYFDYSNKMIHIAKKRSDLPKIANEGTMVNLSINPWSHHMNMPVRFHDTIERNLLLDTGMAGSIAFTEEMVKHFPNKDTLPIIGEGSRGLGGIPQNVQYLMPIKQLHIGTDNDLVLRDFLVKVKEKSSFKAVGMKFFKKFNFTLDWQDGIAIFNQQLPTNPLNERDFGIRLAYDTDSVYIRSVIKGSKADLIGIRPNMKVSAMNNRSITTENEFCTMKNAIKSSDTLRLTLQNTKKDIVLEKFDYKALLRSNNTTFNTTL